MSASPVIGTPQFLNVRSVAGSAGATPQWDAATDGIPLATTSAASHIVTSGNTTTSPIFIAVNGQIFSIPFNVSVCLPDAVWKALDSTVWSYT